ncbi:MAG: hypothetical protein JXA92_08565 [candidate division Zixibacteria bacterium]|nr:hypothetical protein [candidate division Zixibacteria bacterium]
MKHISIIVIISLFLSLTAVAQTVDQAILDQARSSVLLGAQPVNSPFSLLDFSRMKWSHSYSLSYFSGGGYSGSVGVLNTSMFYEFSSKLSLNVNLGIMHNAGAIWGDENNNATLLPGFLLDYHPSNNLSVSIGMQRVSGLYPYYNSGRYYNSWYNSFNPY